MANDLKAKKQGFPDEVALSVKKIGGINETNVSFQQGVTILSGRNATNRTSLLQGIMAALGSNQVSLKADADKGSATLSFGDETYKRTLSLVKMVRLVPTVAPSSTILKPQIYLHSYWKPTRPDKLSLVVMISKS